jgi:hypothetical protein
MLAAFMFALVASVAAGCELAVPGDVPAFECDSNFPNSSTCPPGQSCSPLTHKCAAPTVGDDSGQMVDAAEASDDGEAMAEAGDGPVETGDDVSRFEAGDADGSGPCNKIGCGCSKASDCASGLCADKQAVTIDIYNKAGMMNFCTKPCCTSNDCDPGTVCFGTATGGNYCVDPSWLGRSTPSASNTKGGDGCQTDSDCRSGLCDTMFCADTCCSTVSEASQCNAADDCNYSTFQGRGFDVHFTASCGAPVGNGGNGATCPNGPTDCISDLCTCDTMTCNTSHCHDACRNSPDCGSGQSCVYIQLTDSMMNFLGVVTACMPKGSGTGTQGTQCSLDTDCATSFCSPSNVCTDVCYVDADCSGGWRCLPELVTLKTGGSYEVLDCQL